ncbi:MAG: hypothetical protein K0R26_504 [Bacteroidota bacterium]|nr:hypothetical protein [Bacteroidota bacterium]
MNKKEHNKSISSDELLARLKDKQSGQNNDLDDFESEALEGFASHTDVREARTLIDEMNLSISKKISNRDEKLTQRRVMWFSAAASVLVIFLLTVFFVKKNGDQVGANIALNEPKNEQLIAPGFQSPASVSAEGSMGKNDILKETQLNISEGKTLKQQEKILEEVNEKTVLSAPAVQNVDKMESDEAANISGQTDVASDYVSVEDKLEMQANGAVAEEKQSDSYNRVAQNTRTNSESIKDSKMLSKNADKDTEGESEQKKGKAAENAAVTISTAAPAKKAPSVSQPLTEEQAYYRGGNNALVDYLKKKLSTDNSIELKGKYWVRAIISINGKVSVDTIKQTSASSCNCIEKMKTLLNNTTDWQPATFNGIKTESEVEFEINLDSN